MGGRTWLLVGQIPVCARTHSVVLVGGTAELFMCDPEQRAVPALITYLLTHSILQSPS